MSPGLPGSSKSGLPKRNFFSIGSNEKLTASLVNGGNPLSGFDTLRSF